MMAKLVKIFFCVLLICAAIHARSITSEQVPLAAAFQLRNIFEGVVNCPEGMVPGMLCVELEFSKSLSTFL